MRWCGLVECVCRGWWRRRDVGRRTSFFMRSTRGFGSMIARRSVWLMTHDSLLDCAPVRSLHPPTEHSTYGLAVPVPSDARDQPTS